MNKNLHYSIAIDAEIKTLLDKLNQVETSLEGLSKTGKLKGVE
jgi:hypothetical protein